MREALPVSDSEYKGDFHMADRQTEKIGNIKKLMFFVSDILKTDEAVEAFEFYEGSTLTIEIIKDDVLQKLYFRVKDKVGLFLDQLSHAAHKVSL